MRKSFAYYVFSALMLFGCIILPTVLGSCSKKTEASVEKAEGVAASEEAMQMEAAKRGRSAAKEIVTRNWTDSMQLQQAILEARSVICKYEMEDRKDCAAAFDTAFYNAIKTARPDLATQLKP